MNIYPVSREVAELINPEWKFEVGIVIPKDLKVYEVSEKTDDGSSDTVGCAFKYFLYRVDNRFELVIIEFSLNRYLYKKGSSDPFKGVQVVRILSDLWKLTRESDIDDTFLWNSYNLFEEAIYPGKSNADIYGDLKTSAPALTEKDISELEGIYQLSIPEIGFSKKLWIRIKKMYDWSDYRVFISYENILDAYEGVQNLVRLKSDYLNTIRPIIKALLFKKNGEKTD